MFGNLRFPTRIVQQQGGFPTLEVTITDVRPGASVNLQAPPPATPQPARAEGQLVAPGVWYLSGSPEPNSQLVELRDYTVLIESSVSEARALANLAEARKLVPNKPVRYHLNTHHHGDHAAGVRAFVAEGVSIITHEMNRRFYEQAVLKNPHTLAPDALSRAPRAASFVWVNDKYVLTDGSRDAGGVPRPERTRRESADVVRPAGKAADHHRHLQRLRRAETQRSAVWPCKSLLRGARRASPAAQARRAADRALTRARPRVRPTCCGRRFRERFSSSVRL